MSETAAKHERRRKLAVRGMLLVLALVVGFALLDSKYSTPEGMWDAPEIGAKGFFYLEFKDGMVESVTPDSRFPIGDYVRKGGQWVFWDESRQLFLLRVSWFQLQILDADGRQAGLPRQRLFRRPQGKAVDG